MPKKPTWLAKCEVQDDAPYGEARGTYKCHCGELVTWTRDALWKVYPEMEQTAAGFVRVMRELGQNPKTYAAGEALAFYYLVESEIYKHVSDRHPKISPPA